MDGPAESLFEIGEQATGEERRRLRARFNQEIQIAAGTCLAAGKGAKHLNARDAVTTRYREDAFAIEGLQLRQHSTDMVTLIIPVAPASEAGFHPSGAVARSESGLCAGWGGGAGRFAMTSFRRGFIR
ncbi:MAG TPA: hypothetical protein VHC90_15395 [Bryobacteraceae bacterium]|nr:hypothetical protein [Bryobacteraceae bacterium]